MIRGNPAPSVLLCATRLRRRVQSRTRTALQRPSLLIKLPPCRRRATGVIGVVLVAVQCDFWRSEFRHPHAFNINTRCTTQRYRPDIDGLRAVAIIGVVAYHVGIPGFTGGFAGVDVFFVISGYLITQLLARELAATGTVSIAGFYARRMRRLLPALLVVLLVAVALSWVLLPPAGERQEAAESALAALCFVTNYFFISHLDGYFASAAEFKPFLHLWSLSVEEQFYVVWPLALLAIAYLARSATRVRWMRWAIGGITLGSLILSTLLVSLDSITAFYSLPSRAWELGVGAQLALIPEDTRPRDPRLGRVARATGALLIIGSFLLLQYSTRFPGLAALPAVLGTALLIWGNGQHPTSALSRALSSRVMVAVGVTSYGWYLWHWPLLAFLRGATLMRAGIGSALVTALLAYVLAALSLKYVETPIRRGELVRRAPTAQVLRWGLVSMTALGIVAGATWAWASYGPRSQREQLAVAVGNDEPVERHFDCLLRSATWGGKLLTEQCHFGAADRPTDLVVWGDSHAMALVPLLIGFQHAGVPSFLQLTMGGCQPLVDTSAPARGSERCSEFNKRSLELILQMKRTQGLKGVIVAGRWINLWDPPPPRYFSPPRPYGVRDLLRVVQTGAERPRQSGPAPAEVLAARLSATLELLGGAGLKVFVFLEPPALSQPLSSCAYLNFSDLSRCGISRAEYDAQVSQITRVIQGVAGGLPFVRVFDPLPYFCDATNCPAFIGGKPIVWDTQHMSASTARAFAPMVADDLAWLMAGQAAPAGVLSAPAADTGRRVR